MGKTLARFSSTGLMSHTAGYDTIWLSISSEAISRIYRGRMSSIEAKLGTTSVQLVGEKDWFSGS